MRRENIFLKLELCYRYDAIKPKELKHRIAKFYLDDNFETFTINVTSFGFKHGIQMDADLVFDVRFYQIHTM